MPSEQERHEPPQALGERLAAQVTADQAVLAEARAAFEQREATDGEREAKAAAPVCGGCGERMSPAKAPGRAKKWCSDRCRKRQYDRVCVGCGGRVDGTTPGKSSPTPRCRECTVAYRKAQAWTPEQIITALQAWAREHGRVPTAPEWNLSAEGRPTTNVVIERCGSWNEALNAAGLADRGFHEQIVNAAARAEMVEAYRSGLTAAAIAETHGVSAACVLYHLKKAGQRVLRPGATKYMTRDQRVAAIAALAGGAGDVQ